MSSTGNAISNLNGAKIVIFATVVVLVLIVRRDSMNGIIYIAIFGTGFALLGIGWSYALHWLRTHLVNHQPVDERRRKDVHDFLTLIVGISALSSVSGDGLYAVFYAIVFLSFMFLPLTGFSRDIQLR